VNDNSQMVIVKGLLAGIEDRGGGLSAICDQFSIHPDVGVAFREQHLLRSTLA
jgi:hypothetical protein